HLETFLADAAAAGRTVPAFVRRALWDYLDCGIVERGFALLRCPDCHLVRTVPFSCKNRGFCPSCLGRRMCQTAAHLVDQVLPHVPVRQWVLSLPIPLPPRPAAPPTPAPDGT
ncbi:MAG: transposase zinc-binding domain-containing protein, partial [Deltaproteobacteria bacterium]|nr:transposase zinc-binding domain-containing protein [Deltaproteobacteria bacterium]